MFEKIGCYCLQLGIAETLSGSEDFIIVVANAFYSRSLQVPRVVFIITLSVITRQR